MSPFTQTLPIGFQRTSFMSDLCSNAQQLEGNLPEHFRNDLTPKQLVRCLGRKKKNHGATSLAGPHCCPFQCQSIPKGWGTSCVPFNRGSKRSQKAKYQLSCHKTLSIITALFLTRGIRTQRPARPDPGLTTALPMLSILSGSANLLTSLACR